MTRKTLLVAAILVAGVLLYKGLNQLVDSWGLAWYWYVVIGAALLLGLGKRGLAAVV